MTPAAAEERSAWADASLAASLFSVDPVGLGGVLVRAQAGPVRDRWLGQVRGCLPPASPWRLVPCHVTDERLLGGLDLAATLRAGRPVSERGLLAESDGGVVVLAMAERLSASMVARLTAVMEAGEVVLQRDGLSTRSPARFGVIALDEGLAEDEGPAAGLVDRLALHLDLAGIGLRDLGNLGEDPEAVEAARRRLPGIDCDDEVREALCAAAMAFGIPSLRAPLLALRVARAHAALQGRERVAEPDVTAAARLVLAPRARCLPAAEPPPEEDEAPNEPPPPEDGDAGSEQPEPSPEDLQDIVLAATQAALPSDLLARLRLAEGGRARASTAGRAGAKRQSKRRGRPAGSRRGALGAGARLNVVDTLRAAAPWQTIRRRDAARRPAAPDRPARVLVRADDFRVTRFKHRSETTSIFAVDASGSAALHRLAEAKGAVELLLAECYIRRDQVALVAFRGKGAEILLPPTRSLVRAKRSLASLPGGGGTPMAAGLDAALALAESVRRKGQTPIVILLTDGRANVTRQGVGDRKQAFDEALVAARRFRLEGLVALVVDSSPRGDVSAERLAAEMDARYLALPRADAASLSQAVRAGQADVQPRL